MNRNPAQRWWRLLAALLVPVIIAGGLLAATTHRQARLERVTAALVNDDEMITYNGQPLPVGRLLASALTDTHEANITWELANDAGAATGLKNGTYAAVVTIPKTFSADAASFIADPSHARQAAVQVALSQQAQASDPTLAVTLLNAATTKLNSQLSQMYLQGLFAGFSEQAGQLSQVADGSQKLADGGKQLADGNAQLAGGLDQSKDGIAQLASGIQQLNEGAQQYSGGVTEYTGGVDKVAGGLAQLDGNLPQVQAGVNSYVDGVDQIVGGVGQLATGAQGLSTGIGQVSSTLQSMSTAMPQQVADAAHQTASERGVKQQVTAGVLQQIGANMPAPTAPTVPAVDPTSPQMQQAAQATCAGMSQGMTQAGQPALTAVQLQVCEGAVAQSLAQTATASAQTTADAAAQQSAAAVQNELGKVVSSTVDAAVDAGVTVGANVGWGAGTQAGVQALNTADPTTGLTLAQGAQALADGANKINTNAPAISSGGAQLKTGIGDLASGIDQLNTGLAQVSAASPQINSGAAGLASGTQQLAAGMPALDDGMTKLADASHQLSDGASQLAAGQQQMADGFKNQAQVPNYTPAQRDALSTAIASPVTATPTTVVTESNPAGAVLITLVALWIGALATFLARKAIPRAVARGNRSTMGNLGVSLLPGIVVVEAQAALLSIALALALRPSLGTGLAMTAVMLFAGLVFAVTNHALAAVFGWLGRLVAVGVATLAVAAGMSAAAPAVLAPLAAISPLSAAVAAVSATLAHGTGVSGAAVTLVGWLFVAALLSVFAVVRGERISPASLRAAEA